MEATPWYQCSYTPSKQRRRRRNHPLGGSSKSKQASKKMSKQPPSNSKQAKDHSTPYMVAFSKANQKLKQNWACCFRLESVLYRARKLPFCILERFGAAFNTYYKCS